MVNVQNYQLKKHVLLILMVIHVIGIQKKIDVVLNYVQEHQLHLKHKNNVKILFLVVN